MARTDDCSTLSCADGTTIYITRDIGAAAERYEKYKFDKMVYVVASQQNLHLAQFFKVLELMGYEWAQNGQLQHINFGMGAFSSLSLGSSFR
jgi:arginyl-tRNA synthetase